MTQLLSYGGLVGTETSVEGVKRELPLSAKNTKKDSGRLLPIISTDHKRM